MLYGILIILHSLTKHHNFPQQLMELLSNEDVSDVITWLPHGKGFAILKKNKFAAEGKFCAHDMRFLCIRLYIMPSNHHF